MLPNAYMVLSTLNKKRKTKRFEIDVYLFISHPNKIQANCNKYYMHLIYSLGRKYRFMTEGCEYKYHHLNSDYYTTPCFWPK